MSKGVAHQPISQDQYQFMPACQTCHQSLETEKYVCNLCRQVLFCSTECADVNSTHRDVCKFRAQFFTPERLPAAYKCVENVLLTMQDVEETTNRHYLDIKSYTNHPPEKIPITSQFTDKLKELRRKLFRNSKPSRDVAREFIQQIGTANTQTLIVRYRTNQHTFVFPFALVKKPHQAPPLPPVLLKEEDPIVQDQDTNRASISSECSIDPDSPVRSPDDCVSAYFSTE